MSTPTEMSHIGNAEGQRAVLRGVQIHLELLGLMQRLTVRQTWTNPLDQSWSGRWHFPLAAEHRLLALSSDGGERLHVQRDSHTLCSAAIQMPARGSVTLEWRSAHLLELQDGSLRVHLPAGLAPTAQQALHLQAELSEPIAHGTVSSPHPGWHRVRHRHGMTLSLLSTVGLTQDLSLSVHGLRGQSFAIASPDPADPNRCALLLSPVLPLRRHASEQSALRVKLLVDHSCAMPAERLAALGTALERQLLSCTAQDHFSYTHFGAQTVHELPRMQAGTEAYLRRLRTLLRHTEIGATAAQPEAAIQTVLNIPDEDEEAVRDADVVLVTASPLWPSSPLRQALRQRNHRLHVLAIGPEATHSLWRELAQASGGRFEALAPGQHAQQALERLFMHLRSQFPLRIQLRLDGGQLLPPATQALHGADGQTLHVWAQVQAESTSHDLSGRPSLHATLDWARTDGGQEGTPALAGELRPAPVLWDAQGDIARLLALNSHDDEVARHMTDLALPVIHCRKEPPLCPQLAGMSAVPNGSSAEPRLTTAVAVASDTVSPAPFAAPTRPKVLPSPAQVRSTTTPRPAQVRQTDLPHWLSHPQAPGNPIVALVHGFDAKAGAYGSFRAALASTLHSVPTRSFDGLVLQLSRTAGSPARVWALLLHWLHHERGMCLGTPALTLVEKELDSVSPTQRQQIGQVFAGLAGEASTRTGL